MPLTYHAGDLTIGLDQNDQIQGPIDLGLTVDANGTPIAFIRIAGIVHSGDGWIALSRDECREIMAALWGCWCALAHAPNDVAP